MGGFGPGKLDLNGYICHDTAGIRAGKLEQIGHLEPSLQETLDIVHAHGKLTAPQLADMVGLAINSASNRLKRLYDQRLVRREYEISERGLQYIYHFWQWTGEEA